MREERDDLNALIDDVEGDEVEGKYLTFLCDGQLYGLSIADVIQIVGLQDITSMPGAAAYVKGIINLRGSVIPVIDSRIRLGKEEVPYGERTCIIIVTVMEEPKGLIVDGVDAVVDIAVEDILPAPPSLRDIEKQYVSGIVAKDSKMILLMSIQELLGSGEF